MAYLSQVFSDIIDADTLKRLRQFNIRHVEQLASLLASPTGSLAIERLNLGIDLSQLRRKTDQYLKRHYGAHLSLSTPYQSGGDGFALLSKGPLPALGYSVQTNGIEFNDIVPNFETATPEVPAKPSSATPALPVKHFICTTLPPVHNQHHRGSCVAFAVAAMLEEFMLLKRRKRSRKKFSEQYLFYRAKQSDPDLASAGTTFEYALDALRTHGVCLESDLSYKAHNDWGQAHIFDKAVERRGLDQKASKYRITTFRHLAKVRSVAEIKAALRDNYAVGIGVPVFQDAWHNGFAGQRGEVSLPVTIPGPDGRERLQDTFLGGHAVTLYGYTDTPDGIDSRPGNGFFIFRNSWGSAWAPGNNTVNVQGYGQLPYDYVATYCLDACIITGVAEEKKRHRA